MKKTRTKEEEQAISNAFNANTLRLAAIIQPLSTARWEAEYDWRHIDRSLRSLGEDYGGLEVNPDFQRGHVWTPDQQLHFIENALRGVVASSGFLLQFNCPNWEAGDNVKTDLPLGLQCIDGLQRLTAVLAFLNQDVKPFGLTPQDLEISRFSIRGSSFRFRVAVHTFTKRADLLAHYIAINAGGTPHSKEEIERVKLLQQQALEKK